MVLLWLFVAVGLTGWAVQRSAQVSRLAAPPRYDDINYFNAKGPSSLHRCLYLAHAGRLVAPPHLIAASAVRARLCLAANCRGSC